MCGIVGYVGYRQAIPVLMEGLRRLEYRGYDSAGVAWIEGETLQTAKAQGKLSALDRRLSSGPLPDTHIGLGHTRWATHGRPSEANAHPHRDCNGRIAIVHNGIIENYGELRTRLEKAGHRFCSETDSEVLAHLIEESYRGDLVAAVAKALRDVRGSFALGVMVVDRPHELVAARRHSPLVVGIGDDEAILASDVPAFLPYTNSAIFLEEDELALITAEGCVIFSLPALEPLEREPQEITWSAAQAEKGGFKHFMLKEIFEQPTALRETVGGRLKIGANSVALDGLDHLAPSLEGASRLVFLACGTSWHAGIVARYWVEELAKIPVQVELASEFRYSRIPLDPSVAVVAISQSGETADTLAGLRKAKEHGCPVAAICNVVGSTMTREADATIYTHAGPEIGVASTKAFTSQLAVLYLLALQLGVSRGGLSPAVAEEESLDLIKLADVIEGNLQGWREAAAELAERYHTAKGFLFLGRDLLYPVALEGALKLKEISYIHAEGYAAGEMKHGPIALIDSTMPVLSLVAPGPVWEKSLSNVEEVRSRKGRVICVCEDGDETAAGLAEAVMKVPAGIPYRLQPFAYTVPLQLLAYETAVMKGCDVDQPRNLAKSVTVE